jgi:hypothetical protein
MDEPRLTVQMGPDGPMAAYLRLRDGKVHHTVPELSDLLNFDYDERHLVVGIEILSGIRIDPLDSEPEG